MTDWPVSLRGVTESVVTTEGPNGRYNVAALGVFAPKKAGNESHPDPSRRSESTREPRSSVPTARTWGRTRTRRNFESNGEGHVQFIRDPRLFVEAALSVREVDAPVLEDADAWVRVRVERVDSGWDGETEWVRWRLHAEDSGVQNRVVPTFNRGYAAVVEATVAVSRLDVPGYDTDALLRRVSYFEEVTERCGGPPEHAAFAKIQRYIENNQ